jgi:putative hydrolase
LELAKSEGCLFSIDTDAHAPGQLSWLAFGCAQAVEANISAESIVNTMGLDDFLAWTRSHG